MNTQKRSRFKGDINSICTVNRKEYRALRAKRFALSLYYSHEHDRRTINRRNALLLETRSTSAILARPLK